MLRKKIKTLKDFQRIIESQKFKFAKTMPDNPHHYTLLPTWEDKEEFYEAVQYIRDNGYIFNFKGRDYIQLNVGEYFYWSMGLPARKTTLINRKAL